MSRATPDQIIAHVDLLRAVDRLLTQADVVRNKREALERLLSPNSSEERAGTSEKAEVRQHA
jgi:hypothetical protein